MNESGPATASLNRRQFRGRFFLLNLPAVWGYIALIVHDDPHFLGSMLLISGGILVGQYLVLRRTRGWPVQLLVLFGSMVLFLFLTGAIFSWNSSVGGRPPGSWVGRLDAGIRISILGQLFALPAFFPIAFLNLLLLRRARRPTD